VVGKGVSVKIIKNVKIIKTCVGPMLQNKENL